ncbi:MULTISPECIES: HlyD family efflux transporter periplasmic adaptor subunit [Shewanella]|uniref:efflux RND transporter periplasmic adaptor subunit n=1 Tax=Shewanella TaxID=22 RepID=UPI000C370DB2|nr:MULTISPECIES: HlyD family efflux transporter periplasmic adaptor subunit [Shewanella]NCQ46415.1 HlyD family efflux transporter periplasmic adaptor subunit [Shewanella frigidimarina]NCO72312.1 HlyD family efflux transporter periplasmic adaptor subunit [Shewanella vesiculosa]NCP38380.1 HlyD family efflux transporter periplasmic adaptor subunit [Shewanella vesiculosa]NCP70341.1 HlyD family efflux transporter periplasmic adaptor subunit [Shewanella vesiculosa]NCP75768.1 HlyD family efflux trans
MFEIPKDKNRFAHIKTISIIIITCISLSFIALFFGKNALSSSSSNSPGSLTEVNQGPMLVTVSGYGKLVPKTQRGINTMSSGHIIEVLQQPGNVVNKGDVIIQLNNPKLQRTMETSELALLEQQSNLIQIMAESRQALDDQQGKMRLAKVRLALAQAELSAHEKLKQSQVISVLDLHKAQVAWEQDNAILQMETSRLDTLQQTRKAINNSAQYRLEKAQKQRELLVSEVEQLSIRASMDGMLTELASDLDIGRHLEEGQIVGMIADLSQYYARINITANDAEFVIPGLPAKVAIKGIDIVGNVTRVEPTVNNGSVEIDISFNGNLPSSVRPNIDVNAIIEIANHQNTLVIKRPVGVIRGHRQYSFFVLNDELEQFERRDISIGDIAGEQAQVTTGLHQGERLLLQVPGRLQDRIQFSEGELYD